MDRPQTDDRRTDVDIPQRDREFTFAENISLAFDGIFCCKQTELSDSQRMSSVDVYNHFSCRGRCCCLCWMANRYVVLLMLVVGVFASTRKPDNRYMVFVALLQYRSRLLKTSKLECKFQTMHLST